MSATDALLAQAATCRSKDDIAFRRLELRVVDIVDPSRRHRRRRLQRLQRGSVVEEVQDWTQRSQVRSDMNERIHSTARCDD